MCRCGRDHVLMHRSAIVAPPGSRALRGGKQADASARCEPGKRRMHRAESMQLLPVRRSSSRDPAELTSSSMSLRPREAREQFERSTFSHRTEESSGRPQKEGWRPSCPQGVARLRSPRPRRPTDRCNGSAAPRSTAARAESRTRLARTSPDLRAARVCPMGIRLVRSPPPHPSGKPLRADTQVANEGRL
jgi:hypothetical protein